MYRMWKRCWSASVQTTTAPNAKLLTAVCRPSDCGGSCRNCTGHHCKHTWQQHAVTYDNGGKLMMESMQCKWFSTLTLCGGGEVPLACCVVVSLHLYLLSEVEEDPGVDSCHHNLSLLGACGEVGGRSEATCDQTHGPVREILPLAGVRVLHTLQCSHRSHTFHRKSLDHMAVRGL